MNKKAYSVSILLIIFGLLISACGNLSGKTVSGEAVPKGVVLIKGDIEYSNDFVLEEYYVEHAVALLDMTGFVLRDREWELPVESQVLGYMDLDAEANRASFRLALPAVPEALFNDVDQDAKKERGLQIFAIGYSPNVTGGVFSEGDDPSLGWPSYLASVKTDTENQNEINGGKLVIWAADSQQEFPNGFGADGLLFTKDDPAMPVPSGYSVIDLDQKPFKIIRDQTAELMLYEPTDIAVKDYSALSYKESFDKMYETIRKEYAFNGIPGKQPDWDAVYAELAPKVANAEGARDPYAFYLALRDLKMKFKDGHVSFNGGNYDYQYNESNILGGWGFAVRELDDQRVVVVFVLPGSPADQAGMKVGAELVKFNGEAVQTALAKVKPFEPQSTDFGLRYEQTTFLTRAGIGQNATVEFRNPGQAGKTVQMTSIRELDSLFAVLGGGESDPYVLPAEYELFRDVGVGYLKLNSNRDDLGLAIRIADRAFKTLRKPVWRAS